MHVKLTVINIEYCIYCLASVAGYTRNLELRTWNSELGTWWNLN